jgi:hypothetical protein
MKDDSVSIKITQDVYNKSIECCKQNFQGRFVPPQRGDEPVTTRGLQKKLIVIWNSLRRWKSL